MGTGKSTVSQLLSKKLGWIRYDSDEEIERTEQKRIAELFEAGGEAGFREVESRVICSLLELEEQAVIATGGGAVLLDCNRKAMLDNSLVVSLTADANQIIERVKSDRSRPLLQGDVASNVLRIMEQRRHAYDFAHLVLDTTTLTPAEVADIIIERLYNQ